MHKLLILKGFLPEEVKEKAERKLANSDLPGSWLLEQT